MKLQEVWDLFERIVMYYPGFVPDDTKAAAWHRVLADVPLETAIANLERHARTEKYAPTVADLRAGYGGSCYDGPYIPSAEETRRMLAEMEEAAKRAVPPPFYLREKVRSLGQRNA